MAGKKTKRGPKVKKPTPKARKQAGAKQPPAARKAGKAQSKDSAAKGPGSWWASSVQFLREVKTELKKVTWPSKRQTIGSTGVVLALTGIVSVFLWAVDMVLARLVRLVIG